MYQRGFLWRKTMCILGHVWIDPLRDFQCMKTNTSTFFLNHSVRRKIVNKQTNKQTNKIKQARKQGSKQTNKQTSKEPRNQGSKQTSKQTVPALMTHSQFCHAYAHAWFNLETSIWIIWLPGGTTWFVLHAPLWDSPHILWLMFDHMPPASCCRAVERCAQGKTLEYYAWRVAVGGNGATALDILVYTANLAPL